MQPAISAVSHSTVQALLQSARQTLHPSATASLDAQLLLAHVLGRDRAWILARVDEPVSSSQETAYLDLIRRRSAGVPVAYLRGHVEWYGMDLLVTEDVLIPRPETELLVEQAVNLARECHARVLADIGTGSGAIAIALARSLEDALVYATDLSRVALDIARSNVQRQGVQDRVILLEGNLLEPLPRQPDLLVANLPYLSVEMMADLSPDVRSEPELALLGGPNGLEPYQRMFDQMADRAWRLPLALEIDPRQSAAMRSLLLKSFPGGTIEILPDYAGLDRIALFHPCIMHDHSP